MTAVTTNSFNGLTLAVVPVTTAAGGLNTALVAGTTLVAGILDPGNTERIFNPIAEGNAVQTGDTAATWLPVWATPTVAEVNDQYWEPVFQGGTSQVPQPNSKLGQIAVYLTPAAKNVVEASSVLHFYLSPNALILTWSSGTF